MAFASTASAQVGNIRPLLDLSHSVSLPNPVVIPNPKVPGAPVAFESPIQGPYEIPFAVPAPLAGPVVLPGVPNLPGLGHLTPGVIDWGNGGGEAPPLEGLPELPQGAGPGLPDLALPDAAVLPEVPGAPDLLSMPPSAPNDGVPTLPELSLPAPVVSVTSGTGL
jgi:hypothetical protein